MDEGVDPKDMCRGLLGKVARLEQLETVAEPDILILFEEWLEEIEDEILSLNRTAGPLSCDAVSKHLGLSQSCTKFLLAKLKREGKLS